MHHFLLLCNCCILKLAASLESPDNQRARKTVVFRMQDKGFNGFASNKIKLSVNETKWSSCLAVLLFFLFHFEYLISGAKNYRGFREMGPWHPGYASPV